MNTSADTLEATGAARPAAPPLRRLTPGRLLAVAGVVVALAVPIPAFKAISGLIGGATEARALEAMPTAERAALIAANAEGWRTARSLLAGAGRPGAGRSDAAIGADPALAYAMTQEFIRANLGQGKLFAFPPLEMAKVTPGVAGAWAVRSWVRRWDGKEYLATPYDAVVLYRGDGVWRLDWLVLQSRHGKLRVGQEMAMPTTADLPATPGGGLSTGSGTVFVPDGG